MHRQEDKYVEETKFRQTKYYRQGKEKYSQGKNIKARKYRQACTDKYAYPSKYIQMF